MTSTEHQQLADELNRLILNTVALMDRFEATGMNEALADDYGQLQTLLQTMTRQFREHTRLAIVLSKEV